MYSYFKWQKDSFKENNPRGLKWLICFTKPAVPPNSEA